MLRTVLQAEIKPQDGSPKKQWKKQAEAERSEPLEGKSEKIRLLQSKYEEKKQRVFSEKNGVKYVFRSVI